MYPVTVYSSKPSSRMWQYYVKSIGDMRWCQNPKGCTYDHVHDPTPNYEIQKSGRICYISTCEDCSFKSCIKCQSPWHEGELCAEHQHRLEQTKQEQRDSNVTIMRSTKPCPRCKVPIEKWSGCDDVTSLQCAHHFCYLCGAEMGFMVLHTVPITHGT